MKKEKKPEEKHIAMAAVMLSKREQDGSVSITQTIIWSEGASEDEIRGMAVKFALKSKHKYRSSQVVTTTTKEYEEHKLTD